jgi:hypothetical protein
MTFTIKVTLTEGELFALSAGLQASHQALVVKRLQAEATGQTTRAELLTAQIAATRGVSRKVTEAMDTEARRLAVR